MVRRGLALLRLLPLVLVLLVALPRGARADQPGAHTVPVAVLAFDSEDAEEQADAITGALRSRIRAAQGWSLIETTQSLGMLTAALKCPSRPTPECQQKIGEQLRADRYLWGFVAKGPTQGQVTAEIHLYQKGKADTVLKESYADNLKDSNDDTLRKIAARIVDRLSGTAVGVIVVKATDQTGEVIVDGEKHVPLEKGTARLELAAGGHSVEVSPTGGTSIKRNVLVTAGRETVVEFNAAAASAEAAPTPSHVNTRKIIGGVVMGAGVVLEVVAVVEAITYLGLQSDGDAKAKTVPAQNGKACKDIDTRCNDIDKKSTTASAIAIVTGIGGVAAIGVGAILYFAAPSESSSGPAAAKPKTRVVPTIGAGSGGLVVVGAF